MLRGLLCVGKVCYPEQGARSGAPHVYYLARVGSVIDRGGTGKFRYEHKFSLLKSIEGVEIHAGEGFKYSECSYDEGDTLVVPCRALQTEAQRIGFSLVPMESMCLAEHGQALRAVAAYHGMHLSSWHLI